jgi:hypothetical protein
MILYYYDERQKMSVLSTFEVYSLEKQKLLYLFHKLKARLNDMTLINLL